MALLKRGQCDPLKERGRNGTALAGTLNGKQTTIGSASLGLEFRQVVQAALAAQISRRVADGLDAQSATFLEIFLDAGVFVEHVDDDVHATRDNPGREWAVGVGADLAAEGQLHFVGAAESRLSATSASKKPRACRGASNTRVREVSIWRIESSHQ